MDFGDITLLHNNIISAKIWAYFKLYRNNELNREAQEEEFIKAVDIIMSEAAINEKVFDFVLDIITRGLQNLRMNWSLRI